MRDATLTSPGAGVRVIARVLVASLALVLAVGLPVAAPQGVRAADLSDQIEAARERQQELADSISRSESVLRGLRQDQTTTQSAIAATKRQLKVINAGLLRVRAQIERAQAALDQAQARHDSLVDQLGQTDFTLGLLEQELASGEEDLKARRQALGQRLAEAYRTENTSLLEQVFTAESFSDVLSQASAYLAYGDQDAALVAEIADGQQALDTLRLLTAATRLRTDKLRRDTIETQQQIEARRAELAVARARLLKLEKQTQRMKAAHEARYRELVKNEKEARRIMAEQAAAKAALQRRIAGMVRAAQRQADQTGGGNGPWVWPTTGTITGDYGCSSFTWYPPGYGCANFHDGIDIANGIGTPVRAPTSGVVAYVGWGEGSDPAFMVVLGHAGGLQSDYGHLLPRYVVRAGQAVRKGQLIGYMGNTGFSTGSHTHFQVTRGSAPVNPRAFL
jgi:murein DD-endopeptidase MepM/ murein hydrolase activator NlpD